MLCLANCQNVSEGGQCVEWGDGVWEGGSCRSVGGRNEGGGERKREMLNLSTH